MIETINAMIHVKSPYNKDFASEMKNLGGKWNPENKEWILPENARETVEGLMETYFPDGVKKSPELRPDPNAKTMKARVDAIVADASALYSGDTFERMVAFAYQYGRETEAKIIGDQYVALIRGMKKKAGESRYKTLILDVIGERDYLYFEEYFAAVTKKVGPLETEL